MAQTKPPTIASLPLALRGLVLDHLTFNHVLNATTTDRAGRAAFRSIRNAWGIKEAILMPNILSKLARCESITIFAKSAGVMERLAWVLRDLRLREVKVSFSPNADMSSWSRSCDALAHSMDDVSRIELFRLRMNNSEILKPTYLGAESFHAILFRLPLNSALEAAMHGQVPHDVVNTLLSRGANPNHIAHLDGTGQFRFTVSMLSKACKFQTVSVIRLLLEKGARHSQQESYDSFHWAVQRQAPADAVDILRLLYDAGLQSWTRIKPMHGGLLHYFVLFYLGRVLLLLNKHQTFAAVKLIAERQPLLLTLFDRDGRTPLTLLLSEQVERQVGGGLLPEPLELAKVLVGDERVARRRGAP